MQARVEELGVDDVAVREGDDVVLVDDVLENVGVESAEAGVERTVGDIDGLAVERTFVACDRGKDTAAGVLKFADECGKSGAGVGCEAALESKRMILLMQARRSAVRGKMCKFLEKKSAGLGLVQLR